MVDTEERARTAVPAGRHGAWLSGLDGLRALAVTAVVVFHFLPATLPGGFLGVDLFFVISGFLITRLLLAEIDRHGNLSLADFYLRRARRLLPAAFLVVAACLAGGAMFWPDQLASLRGAVPAAVFYASNWWLIGDHQSYFVSSGRPSMLQHFWSLAIEEQFYLLWPLLLGLLVGAYVWRRRTAVLTARGLAILASGSLALAGLSTTAMAVIAIRTDVPFGADSNRIYFGTDTHSMGLLLGASAAAFAVLSRFGSRRVRTGGTALTDLLGAAAIVGLVVIMRQVGEFDPGLYRGGFLAVSAVCVVAVVTVSRRGSAIGWLLDRAPLRWLGQRSYSIYLWHWPVAVVTRPDVDVVAPSGMVLALRLALTLVLAEGSYRLVEQPIRTGGIHALATTWQIQRLSANARSRLAPIGLLACLAVGASVASGIAPRLLEAEARPASALAGSVLPYQDQMASARRPVVGPPAPRAVLGPYLPARPSASPAPPLRARTSTLPSPARTGTSPAPAPAVAVSAFGDSVMLGAAAALHAAVPTLRLDAVEGRQARAVFADIAAQRAGGSIGKIVVIHTGDNGIISPADLRAALASLASCTRVVVVTDRVPRDWEAPNNATLRSVTGQFRNAALVDWHTASQGHRDWFYRDGLHLTPAGAQAYAALVAAKLR